MKMHGNFEIADVYNDDFKLDLPEFFKTPEELSSYYVRVKFKNAEVIRTRSMGSHEFRDATVCYEFIARDKAMLGRLKKFVKTKLFEDILYGRLGTKGKIDIEL